MLQAFFARENGYFLTGGAALAGYHLGHRSTSDLDLFTLDADTFERGRFVLEDVAQELGAALRVDAGITADELREWLDSLIVRLRAEALPKPLA